MSRDPREPAIEPYCGPAYADTYAARNLWRIGQMNPSIVSRWRSQRGRFLSGLGGHVMQRPVEHDPLYRTREILDLEKEEDVNGSGIFDQDGRQSTSNANMGIFAGNYSLPGYLAREVPFTVSREIQDITDDAAVVMVPGGGMSYIERGGRAAGAKIQPAPPTAHDQVYAYLSGQQPRRVRPQSQVPTQRQLVPVYPHQEGQIQKVPIFQASQQPVPVSAARYPVSRAAPSLPSEPEVSFVSTFNVGSTRPVAISAYGQENEEEPKAQPTPAWQLAVAGVMVGAAAALLWEVAK